jgi:hypothetical protein
MSTSARAPYTGLQLAAERIDAAAPEGERPHGEARAQHPGNADVAWDRFDPNAYVDHNYKILRMDDHQILELVRDHFSKHFAARAADRPRSGLFGADLGAGPNLYPALSMLPWVDRIELIDYSPANCAWLREEVKYFGPNWNPFWDLLATKPAYAAVDYPRHKLASVAKVVPGSLFEPRHEVWDLATMFFVAESISSHPEEFAAALDGFVDALRPGAPFAAAFMERSTGYEVGTERFPAVPVIEGDIRAHLGRCGPVVVERVGLTENPLRDGYSGMIIALGMKSAG